MHKRHPLWDNPYYHDSWTPLAYQWGMLQRLHELNALHLAPNGKRRDEDLAQFAAGNREDLGNPDAYACGRKAADELYQSRQGEAG